MEEDISRGAQVHEVVAYELNAYDGGLKSFAYWETPRPGIHCPQCSGTLDFQAVSTEARISARWDISSARGRLVASERFRRFCTRRGYDVQFPVLDDKRRLFELRPTRLVEVDLDRSRPLFTDFCPRCGNFQCYLRGGGLFLRHVFGPLPDGFYRSDIAFGCSMSKSPIILVGPETMLKLKKARFPRLKFTAVPYSDPGFDQRKADMEAVDLESREEGGGQVAYTKVEA